MSKMQTYEEVSQRLSCQMGIAPAKSTALKDFLTWFNRIISLTKIKMANTVVRRVHPQVSLREPIICDSAARTQLRHHESAPGSDTSLVRKLSKLCEEDLRQLQPMYPKKRRERVFADAPMKQRIIEVALGVPHTLSTECAASSWTRCPKSFTENGQPSEKLLEATDLTPFQSTSVSPAGIQFASGIHANVNASEHGFLEVLGFVDMLATNCGSCTGNVKKVSLKSTKSLLRTLASL